MSKRPLVLLRVATRPFEALKGLGPGRSVRATEEFLAVEKRVAESGARLEEALHLEVGERAASRDEEGARRRLRLLSLRRDVHNGRPLSEDRLREAGELVLPALASALREHGDLLQSLEARRRACREAFEEDLHGARSGVMEAVADPLVEHGIWLASRPLLEGLRRLKGTDPRTWGHRERHLAGKALAYLTRFSTKTSPNGLFCATALVAVADGPSAIEGNAEIAHLDALLNVAEARKIAACLAIDPAIDRAIVPRPNPTIHEEGGAWTFWRPASMRRAEDDEDKSRVREHPVVRAFLEEAARGTSCVPTLLETIGRRFELDPAEIEPFYRQLVDRGLLVGEVEIPYNERRPLRFLATACRLAGCSPTWLSEIESVEKAVDDLPSLSGGERTAAMKRIGGILESLPHERPLHPDELFRLDAASAIRVQLPGALLEEARGGLRPYVRLFAALYPERASRSALAARFLRHFETDRDVRLLDAYHGVFEPREGTRPAALPDPRSIADVGDAGEKAREAFERARDLFASLAREAPPGEEIEVAEARLTEILGPFEEPQWSCGVLFQVAAESPLHIDRGDYRIVLSSLFQGSGLALARFAHLLGGGDSSERNPVVRELVRGWSSIARPGAIVAEMTYNHGYRTANAGLRPSIFHHEIELPGEKASPGAEAIPLRDLLVRWDSGGERFVLRWARTGEEVIPVINSGVNPVGVISFLIRVGQQELQPLGYFPGFSMPGVAHWPRFVRGRTVIFRERWVFEPGEWPAPSRNGRLVAEMDYFLEVARWRSRHRIPRHVFVHSSLEPKPRYTDLDSPAFVDLLQRSLAAAGREAPQELHVTEMLPGPSDLWIEESRGRYAAEFLVQMHGPMPPTATRPPR